MSITTAPGSPAPTQENHMTSTAASTPSRQHGSHLILTNMRKVYNGQVAIDDVSLEVLPGEFMTLLGPSGSGKTTTLNIVSGFADATSGTLSIDGVTMDDVPPRKRGIGMVFQNYALFPHMTVEQNIEFPLQQRKVPKAARRTRVAEALRSVRLDSFGKRFPAELSGGQQQRVALARAIVFEPGLLLMDEPLGALDRGLRESMQLEIRRIHREVGSTVIFVTHDQEEALALSDRIAVFNNGNIEQVGTGDELYLRPATVFVARFLGESTLLTGTRESAGASAGIRYADRVVRIAEPADASAERLTVVIRPERARHPAPHASIPESHEALDVVVDEDIYLGHDRKLRVSLPDGTVGIVRESAGAMSTFSIGDRAKFVWAPADTVALPAEPAPLA
jgi:putative spermidine/putrescine transport system ATP-binding protein